ncbi:MAG: 30S ribosomal protein S13 [Candidatus Altiarchaeum hamiconexum]|uniref:Small ribosomal subunit protein uS13 n=1 Tax=Candidatus Altarchaeum hamiconexum TaxID=1803513 RepID=A0A8J7Z0W4_9ARCH|nr:30S ribosomal protein S13 [Candidatus Altarchaeum hamiconexum]PIN67480.1 MAG: 30S ribosomal protein S13 [Candidatus Altarchaeum sp. CG12_big_fil_rev_8_21_14_0_65_33_22]PIX49095.1 MAG: 30S ribosomal protein S13 [Candidatus Altarchaeum sp. CG_4_8_14_3_um_filter_33_2054]PJC15826.1 MAG: 30S ribosomal protein S13 [Candidatus Altarchaeum sp. CG_4_9_14_0_8_um_filter_32_206]
MVTEKKEERGKEKKEERGKEKKEERGKEKKGKEKKDIAKTEHKESNAQTHRIVRLLEYALNGDRKVSAAMRDIKGIGYRIASILSKKLNTGDKLLADLDADEISHLETALKNVNTFVPSWMINHKNDQFTGTNLHPVGTDLELAVKNDIEFMQKIKTYKGIRHTQGQPVRGQRTRTSFRKGKSVGVVKKKSAPAKEGAKKSAAPGGKTAKK